MSTNLPPLQFVPVLKQTIWGGRRLGETLGKPIGDDSNYAESWEVVDHGDDQSVVCGGDQDGLSLGGLLSQYGAHLMGAGVPHHAFPLLLKYLDCNRDLSVQVHPNDEYAGKMSPPDLGKTEAWYIVDSQPDALIYAGLQNGVDRRALAAAIEAGQTQRVLHSFHPDPGDVVFIPAGTVHALGAGLLVAEIQQSSDTTFRLFDWNRVDADGNSRQLHLDQGLEVTDYESGPVSPRTLDPSASGQQTLVECEKFVLGGSSRGQTEVATRDRFEIITIPRGTATLEINGKKIPLKTGDTRFLPASCAAGTLSVDADSTALLMRLPN